MGAPDAYLLSPACSFVLITLAIHFVGKRAQARIWENWLQPLTRPLMEGLG